MHLDRLPANRYDFCFSSCWTLNIVDAIRPAGTAVIPNPHTKMIKVKRFPPAVIGCRCRFKFPRSYGINSPLWGCSVISRYHRSSPLVFRWSATSFFRRRTKPLERVIHTVICLYSVMRRHGSTCNTLRSASMYLLRRRLTWPAILAMKSRYPSRVGKSFDARSTSASSIARLRYSCEPSMAPFSCGTSPKFYSASCSPCANAE